MSTDSTDSTTATLDDVTAAGRQLTDMVVANPVPSVLAAAATGAGLMALIALMARPSSRLPSFSDLSAMATSKLPSAPDLPDTDSLKNQIADLLQRFTSAIPSRSEAKQHVQDATDSATDTAHSAWDSVRDQAASVLGQVQPQLNAATKVARENPLWSAVLAGAIGTIIGAQFLGRNDR